MPETVRDRGALTLVRTSQPIVIGDEFVDKYGMVNHAAYPLLFERDRNGIMVGRKTSFEKIHEQYGLIPVAESMSIEYKRALKQDDEVRIDLAAYLLDQSIFTFLQEMKRAGKVVATSKVVSYFLGASPRPAVLPDSLIRHLSIPEAKLREDLKGIQGEETFPYSNYLKAHSF